MQKATWFDPEKVLYFYMAICIAILFFNIAYIFYDKFKLYRLERRSYSMVGKIDKQIDLIEAGGKVQKEHMRRMLKQMKKLEKLRAFEFSMNRVREKHDENSVRVYLEEMRKTFIHLIPVYEKRDVIEQAYFAAVAGELGISKGRARNDGLMDFMIELACAEDVYVRENALKAIYSMGNKNTVLNAFEQMNDNEIFHSGKLLTDGLLSFTGDREELARILWSHSKEFYVELRLPIMQFIRFSTGSFKEEFFSLLCNENADKELRLEAVRYFRRYVYEPAKGVMQSFINNRENIDWEFAAMAAASLTQYPGEDTVKCLKSGLGSGSWYIRLNCAEALINGMSLPEEDLFDVFNGRDRYAREILNYVKQKNEIVNQDIDLRAM